MTDAGLRQPLGPPSGWRSAQLRVQIVALLDQRLTGPSSPLLTALTVRWLLSTPPALRRHHLSGVASWLQFGVPPQAASPAEVRMWVQAMATGPRSGPDRRVGAGTIRQWLAGVSSWYQYLCAHGGCDRNPAAEVTTSAVHRNPTPVTENTPTIAASAALVELAAAEAHRLNTEIAWRDAAVASLLFYTALTPAILCGIGLHHVIGLLDPDGPLTVWAAMPTARDGYQQLSDPAARPLRAYLYARAERHGVPPRMLQGCLLAGPVAPSAHQWDDRRLSPADLHQILDRSLRLAGISATTSPQVRASWKPIIVPHDLLPPSSPDGDDLLW